MTGGPLATDSVRDAVLQGLLERIPVIVFAAGRDGICTYSEGAGLHTLGYGPGELVGVDLFEAYAHMPREVDHLRQALSGRSLSYSWRLGDTAFDTWLAPLHDADGEVNGLLGISVDVTDRVSAQDELELHKAFVETAPQFVALADADGSVRYVNPGGRRMAGIPDDVDVTVTTIADYLTDEGLRRSVEVEQPAVLAHGSYDGETTLRHWPTGRGIPVRVSSFLVADPLTGEPRGLATVQTDISAQVEVRREAERRLSQQRGLLLHLHEAQETERRRIAHEVHDDTVQAVAALNIRLQSARRLMAQGEHEKATEMLDALADSVGDAADRLRRLLVGLDVPAQLETDLVSALRDHVTAVCAGEPLECTVSGALPEPPPAHVSRVLFRIAQEAVANVRTHAEAQHVTLTLRERDNGFLLSVRDDGLGLPTTLSVTAGSRPVSPPGHLGLRSMVERAESVGGWCSVRRVDAHQGGGTLVEAWLPARLDYSATADSMATGDGPTTRVRLEQTLESISEGFAALDRDWRYVYVNQVGADIVRRHDLPGKVCWEEFDFSPETEAAYRDAVRLQRPTVARVLYSDLGRWVENRVYPSQEGISVFFRDVTAEHDLEQEAAERQQVVRGGQAVLAALVDEPDLEAALTDGLTVLCDAWGLAGFSLEVEHPVGRRIVVRLGDTSKATLVLPVRLHGGAIGSVRSSPTPFAEELQGVCDLVALRVAAAGEPFAAVDRSEGHVSSDS